MKPFIYGAGAQGRMILDVLRAAGAAEGAVFVDDAPALRGTVLEGCPVVGEEELLRARADAGVIVAIGKPKTRIAVADRLAKEGVAFMNAIHPAAAIMPSAKIGNGCVIGAGVVVDTGVELGDHAIVNPMVLVGHDAKIARGVTFSGGAVVGGRVTVGEGAFLCLSCAILPRVVIGAGAIVGAGAVVYKDVDPALVATGNPARGVSRVDDTFDWSKVL